MSDLDETGCFGVLVGTIGFRGIPNYPHNHGTTYVTPEMAEMAQYRMKVSAGGLTATPSFTSALSWPYLTRTSSHP
jgi:hypothetical protein